MYVCVEWKIVIYRLQNDCLKIHFNDTCLYKIWIIENYREQTSWFCYLDCLDFQLCIKQVFKIPDRMRQQIYLVFFNLSPEFDQVPRKWLSESIKPDIELHRLYNMLEICYFINFREFSRFRDFFQEIRANFSHEKYCLPSFAKKILAKN